MLSSVYEAMTVPALRWVFPSHVLYHKFLKFLIAGTWMDVAFIVTHKVLHVSFMAFSLAWHTLSRYHHQLWYLGARGQSH